MEIKKLKKTTTELEIEILHEDETMLNPILQLLLKNKDVDYAEYFTEHPESPKRRFYLRVKKGKPEEILKQTVKQLEQDTKTFIKMVEEHTKTK